jgi:AraC-like DNA-binding protein
LIVPRRVRLDSDPSAQAALAEAVRAHHELLDAEERFDAAMWAARRAGVSVRDLAAAVAMSKSHVSRRYKAI